MPFPGQPSYKKDPNFLHKLKKEADKIESQRLFYLFFLYFLFYIMIHDKFSET
jgi:hypothetical protein